MFNRSDTLDQIAHNGFCVLEAIEQSTLQKIAEALGTIVVDSRSPELIRAISPQDFGEAKENTLSSRYGMGMFPFHTDVAHWRVPAKYVLLYCAAEGSGRRPTLLQDCWTWRWEEKFRRAALHEIWKTGLRSPSLCTVATLDSGSFSLRFDAACMKPMTNGALQFQSDWNEQVRSAEITEIHWVKASLLVIDNHRMLHARGEALKSDFDRVIKRILIGV